MAFNPLSFILGGAKTIVNQGKKAVTSFLDAKDNSTAGIIRNTITGLVPAAKTVAKDATTVVKNSAQQLVKPAVDLVKGEGIYAPQTGAGVARNTLLGLPKAAVDVAKEIAQGTARTVGTVGITAGNAPTQIVNKIDGQNRQLPFASEIPTNQNPITNAIFGGKPIKDLKTYGQSGLDFADELMKRADPNAGPLPKALSVPVGIAGVVLDLGGGGGKGKLSETVVKKLIEATTDDVAEQILVKELKMSAANAKKLAPELASSNTVDEVYQAFGVKNASKSASKAVKSAESKIHPDDLAELKDFNDYVYGAYKPGEKEAINLEISTRRIIEKYGLGNSETSNNVLASKIGKILDNAGEKVLPIKDEIKSPLETIAEQAVPKNAIDSKLPSASESGIVGLEERPRAELGTGEARSLEKAAEQSRQAVQQDIPSEVPSLGSMIPQQTPLKQKVGFLDYLRTPDAVMKKIGLEPQAKMLRTQYEKYLKELPVEVDKITQWAKSVPKESNERIFRFLDNENIDLNPAELKVATEVKQYLKEWADKLGLPEDKRVSSYITHLFDDQLVKKEFDEDLAKIIRDKIPGSVYDPFLQQRLGAKGYKQDTWAALDAYVKRATRKVNLDPALEEVRLASETLEDSQWNYMKSYVDQINMRPTNWDNLLDNTIKQSPIAYRLGARPTANISKTLRQTAFRGMLGGNIGSALRNLSQGINTFAKLGTKDTALGYAKFAMKGKAAIRELEEVGVLADNFVADRSLSATKKAVEKLDKGLFVFFDTAEKINRGAAYFGAKGKAITKGMSEAEAIDYAKKIVRDTQFNYGKLDTPVTPLLSSDIGKVFLQFLTYPVKQTEFLAGMAKNKEYMGIARYVIGGLAFMYTVGKAFGMEPKDLVPFSGYVSGESKFGVPPSLKLPAEIIKAGFNAPDKFGQERSGSDKLKDITKAAWGVIPGGIQLKKTLEGITAANEGGSFDASGKKQYSVTGTGDKIQSILMGKSSSSGAQDYFDGNTEKKKAMNRLAPVYEEAQRLKASGDTEGAAALVDNLSDADYEIYKQVKQSVTTANTVQGKKDIAPTYARVQQLKAEGNEAEAKKIVDGLSDDEYKYYELVKKQAKKDYAAASGTKPTYENGEPQTEKGIINTVMLYAKALSIDPVQAFDAMFTKEKLRYATGNVVVVERLPLAESQKIKADQNGNTSGFKLDHTVPLEMGGDNDESNLKLVPTESWASYTKVENFLGKALRDGKANRSEAQKAIRKFKNGEMTADEVYALFK